MSHFVDLFYFVMRCLLILVLLCILSSLVFSFPFPIILQNKTREWPEELEFSNEKEKYLHSMSNKKILYLAHNRLKPKDVELIRTIIKPNDCLESVHLSRNTLGDHSVVVLAEWLKGFKNLGCLNVNCNLFGDEGLKALTKALPHLPKLKTLDISFNKYTKEGFEFFLEEIKRNTTIKELIIGDLYFDVFDSFCEAMKCNDTIEIFHFSSPGQDRPKKLDDLLMYSNSIVEVHNQIPFQKHILELNKSGFINQRKKVLLMLRRRPECVVALLPRRLLIYLFQFLRK